MAKKNTVELALVAKDQASKEVEKAIRKTNREFNSLNASLKRLGVDAKEIDKISEEIKEANPSILENELENVRKQLQRLGVDSKYIDEVTKELKKAETAANEAGEEMSSRFSRLGTIIGGVTAGLGGMTAATAPVVAGVGAIGASFAAAGVGAVAFGAVAVGALSQVFEASEEVAKLEEKIAQADMAEERIAAQKELAALYKGMSKEQQGALQKLIYFKSYWTDFVASFEKPVFQAFGVGLQVAMQGLELLKPTIQNVADVVVELMTELNKDMSGGGMKKFFDWLSTNAAESLYNFAQIGGNVMGGFFSLLQAFSPLGASMEEGLVSLTEKFKTWAEGLSTSTAFRDFIAYTQENGPVLMDILGNVGKIIGDVVTALAPLGAVVLDAADGLTNFLANSETARSFFDFLANVGTTIKENWGPIKDVILGVAAAVGSFKLMMAGMTIIGTINTLMGALKAGTVAQTLAQWGLNTAMLANPATWVIAGISALIAIGVLLYKNWDEVSKGLGIAWDWLKKKAGEAKDSIVEAWDTAKKRTSEIFTNIKDKVTEKFNETVTEAENLPGRIGDGIKNMASKAVDKATELSTEIKTTFSNKFTEVITDAKNLPGKIGTGIRETFEEATSAARDLAEEMKKRIAEKFDNIVTAGKELPGKVGTGIREKIEDAASAARELAGDMKTGISETFDEIVTGAKELPGKIGDGIKGMANDVLDGVNHLANKLAQGIGKGINGVIRGVNWVLDKVGVKSNIKEWSIPQYAKGTGGHPGGLAILGDGKKKELFITPDGQMGMSPATDTLMNLPKGTTVLSGDKTQKLLSFGLIPAYKNGIGDWDIWSYIANPKELFGKVLEKFGVETPSFPGILKDFGKGAFNKVKDGFQGFLKKKLSDFGSFGGDYKGGVASASQVRAWITQALKITGTSMSWLEPLVLKAFKESTFNPRAINLWDSNAKKGTPSKGLLQTIDPTFNRYKMSGMNDIYNPVHNAVAAIRYIKDVYGNVWNTPGIKSMMKGGSYKGYARGGIVDAPQLAWLAEGGWPETVISHDPALRGRSRMLYEQTGRKLGFEGGNNPEESRTLNITIMLDREVIGRAVAPIVADEITVRARR